MREMSLGMQFLREAKFRRQTMDGKKKKTFGELSTEEIQERRNNAVPATTKKAIKFAMRIFNDTYPLSFL